MSLSGCVRAIAHSVAALFSILPVLIAQQAVSPLAVFNSSTPTSAARDVASVAVLTDGRMIISGGNDANTLNTIDIYDPAAKGRWVGYMSFACIHTVRLVLAEVKE
jgi:hypothetical protein